MRALALLLFAVLPAADPPRPSGTVPSAAGSATGLLRGRVVDPEGRGIAGARVKAMKVDPDTAVIQVMVEATTDRAGAFTIANCPAGRIGVTAGHPAYATEGGATTTVDPGSEAIAGPLELHRGGRIVGSVSRRDGQPVPQALVAFVPSSANGSFRDRPPMAVRADGTFELQRVVAGPGTLLAVVDPGGPGQRIATETIEVREDDTTSAGLVTPEVVVSGRITRSGRPGSGLRVAVVNRTTSNERRLAESLLALGEGTVQGKSTMTDEDGAFTVTVNGPGPAFLSIRVPDESMSFPSQDLEIPDSDTHYLEVSVGGAAVSGIVVDGATRRAIEGASVCANPAAPAGRSEKRKPYVSGSCTRSDEEGAFRLEVEPGGYVLRASDFEHGYGKSETPVSVPDSGLDELQLTIDKTPSIQVRAVDAGGRPIAGAFVTACDDQGKRILHGRWSPLSRGRPGTDVDGRLFFDDLEQRPYSLFAISMPDGTVGFRPGVRPGPDDAVVPLRPGSKLTVRAMSSAGPVAGAQVDVQAIDGHPVAVIHHGVTDEQGIAVLSMPAGSIEVAVRWGRLAGRGVAAVPAGGEGEVTVPMASTIAGRSR